MNAIELLRQKIIQVFPQALATLDAPKNPDGHWFLDVITKKHRVVVEWRPQKGFGISDDSDNNNHGYGEGPDKVFEQSDDALAEIFRLLEVKS